MCKLLHSLYFTLKEDTVQQCQVQILLMCVLRVCVCICGVTADVGERWSWDDVQSSSCWCSSAVGVPAARVRNGGSFYALCAVSASASRHDLSASGSSSPVQRRAPADGLHAPPPQTAPAARTSTATETQRQREMSVERVRVHVGVHGNSISSSSVSLITSSSLLLFYFTQCDDKTMQ